MPTLRRYGRPAWRGRACRMGHPRTGALPMGNHSLVAWFETNGIRVARVGVDCADVDLMVRFWSAALGYEVARISNNTAELRHPASAGPKLCLRRVTMRTPGRNRLQLDLYAVD